MCNTLIAKFSRRMFGLGLLVLGSVSLAQGKGLVLLGDVEASSRLTGELTPGMFTGLSMAVTDKLSIESFFRGKNSLSPGVFGTVSRLQSYTLVGQTLMGQYRFGDDQSTFRPRLGAGLAYNLSQSDRLVALPSALHGDGAWAASDRSVNGMGVALELGASYALSKSWTLEGSVMKSFIRASGSALGAGASPALPGLRIDPLMFTLSVGFKFQ